MAEVFSFKPKSERAYTSNLSDFISYCKVSLTVLSDNPTWAWHNLSWQGIGSFTKHGYRVNHKNAKSAPANAYMSPPFSEFAKAFIRYRLSTRGGQVIQFLLPLRSLEEALLVVTSSTDVTKSNNAVFDEAAAIIRTYTSVPTARYDHGRRLQLIASFLADKSLSTATTWVNPFASQKRYNSRLDSKSKQKATAKLPSEAALNALAEIFSSNPQDAPSIFATSYAALLMSAPSRVSEVLNLNIGCIHKEIDSFGDEQLGLRWHSNKGGGSDVKYVPSSMQQVVEEAVTRLKILSEHGRAVAKWYEKNDGAFYRPKHLRNIPDDQPLSVYQICELLNVSSNNTKGINDVVRQYLRNNPEIYQRMLKNKGVITFSDLNVVAQQALPNDFPYIDRKLDLKWSNSLFCYRLNELHHKAVRPYELWIPSGQIFNSLIRKTQGRKSIFERYGYKEADGTLINVTSHQFRHYLNTLAQKGAVGELDIAKWSGRANIHENNVYNHMQDEDHLANVQNTEVLASLNTPLAKIKAKDKHAPVTVADLGVTTAEADRIAHITELGFCVHDFAFSPCAKFSDCANCSEHVCVKGDYENLTRIKSRRELLNNQLQKALQANGDNVWGADRWVAHQTRTIERLDNKIEILESENVEDGAVIRLKCDYEDTPVKRMIDSSTNGGKTIKIAFNSKKRLKNN